jgi:hypothetical protein
MYITMDRTRTNPIALLRALPHGHSLFFREMTCDYPARAIWLQRRFNGLTDV